MIVCLHRCQNCSWPIYRSGWNDTCPIWVHLFLDGKRRSPWPRTLCEDAENRVLGAAYHATPVWEELVTDSDREFLASLGIAGYAEPPPPCLRSNGTERAWFLSRDEAVSFAAANPVYHGDIAHLCNLCGRWHLSRPEWLRDSDFRCACGCPLQADVEYFILKNGDVFCATCLRVRE